MPDMDEEGFYDNSIMGNLMAGDYDFEFTWQNESGRKSYLSKLLTKDITEIICVSPLLNYNLAGVAGTSTASPSDRLTIVRVLKKAWNAWPLRCPGDLWKPTPEATGVALNITDALICQYQGEETNLLDYSTELDQYLVQQISVALDTLRPGIGQGTPGEGN